MSRLVRGLVETLMFPGAEAAHEVEDRHIYYLPVPRLGLIAPIWILPASKGSSIIILYAHGNGTDIGSVRRELELLGRHLHVHICAMEYPGYGKCQATDSQPIEQSVDIVAEAVLDFIVRQLYWPLNNVVFWGTSIGSGVLTRLCQKVSNGTLRYGAMMQTRICDWPKRCLCKIWEAPLSCAKPDTEEIVVGEIPTRSGYIQFDKQYSAHVCDCQSNHQCRKQNDHIGGLILQCPLSSIRKTASHIVGNMMSKVVISSETYNNEIAIQSCRTNLLILHGQKDEMFDYKDSEAMLNNYHGGSKIGVFPKTADHNNWSLKSDILEPLKHFFQYYVRFRVHRVQLPVRSKFGEILYDQPSYSDGPPLPIDVLKHFRPEVYRCCLLRYMNGNIPLVKSNIIVPDVNEHHPTETPPAAVKTPFARLRRRLRVREPLLPADEYTHRIAVEKKVMATPFLWQDNVSELLLISYNKLPRLSDSEVSIDPYPTLSHIPESGLNRYFEVHDQHDHEYKHEFNLSLPQSQIAPPRRPASAVSHDAFNLLPSIWTEETGSSITIYNRIVEDVYPASDLDHKKIHQFTYHQDVLELVADAANSTELIQRKNIIFPKPNRFKAFLECHKNASMMFVHCKKRLLGSLMCYLTAQRRAAIHMLINNTNMHIPMNNQDPKATILAKTGRSSRIGNIVTSVLRHLILTAALPASYLIYIRHESDGEQTGSSTDDSMAAPGYQLYGLFQNGFFAHYGDDVEEPLEAIKIRAEYLANGVFFCNEKPERFANLGSTFCLFDLFPFPEYLLIPICHQRYEARLRTALGSDILKLLLDYELRNANGQAESFEDYCLNRGLWRLSLMTAIDFAVADAPTLSPAISLTTATTEETVTAVTDVCADLHEFLGRLNSFTHPLSSLLAYITIPADHTGALGLCVQNTATNTLPILPAPPSTWWSPWQAEEAQRAAVQLFRFARDTLMATCVSYKRSLRFSLDSANEEDSGEGDTFGSEAEVMDILEQLTDKREIRSFADCVAIQLRGNKRSIPSQSGGLLISGVLHGTPDSVNQSLRKSDMRAVWYVYNRLIDWKYLGQNKQVVSPPNIWHVTFTETHRGGDLAYHWQAAHNVSLFQGGLTRTDFSDDPIIQDAPDDDLNLDFLTTSIHPHRLCQAVLDTVCDIRLASAFFQQRRYLRANPPVNSFKHVLAQLANQVTEDDIDSKVWRVALAHSALTRRLPQPPEPGVEPSATANSHATGDQYLSALWYPHSPIGHSEGFTAHKDCLKDLHPVLFELLRDPDFAVNDYFVGFVAYTHHCSLRLWRNVVKFRLLDLYGALPQSTELQTFLAGNDTKFESICRLGVMLIHQWLSRARHSANFGVIARSSVWEHPAESSVKLSTSPALSDAELVDQITALQDCFVFYQLALGNSATMNFKLRKERQDFFSQNMMSGSRKE